MTAYRTRAYIELLIVSLIWGVASPVIKFTLGGISPLPFLTYRFFLATIFGLVVIFVNRSHKILFTRNFGGIFLYSVFATTIALGLLFLGMNQTTVLDAILITAISPLVTAVFGVLFLKETITRQEKIGIGIALLGTVITVVEPILDGTTSTFQLGGNILVMGYLLTNAYSAILAKKLVRKEVKPFVLSNFSFVIGFITIAPLAFIQTSPTKIISTVTNLTFPFHLGVFYMAFVSGIVAYALWIKGQKSIEVSEAGLFAYLTPLFGAPLAVLWLGEKITPIYVLGALIIAFGVLTAEYKKRKLKS